MTLNKLLKELIIDSLEEYDCPICCELMYSMEIYQCNEGHFACKSCWIRQLETKKECFECRRNIVSLESLSRLRVLEKQLANKDILCPYKEQCKTDLSIETGCAEVFKIGNLDTHIKECDFRLIKCQNENCFTTFRFNSTHTHDCQFQKVNCERCKKEIIKKSIGKEHDGECLEFEIKCWRCHLLIKRSNLISHNENDCLESTIPCKYSQYGCNQKIKRKDLEKHLIDPIHIKLLFNYIDATKQYQNKWIISNYSNVYENKKNGEFLESPIFYIGNFLFNMEIYPNGVDEERSQDVLIFLYNLNECDLSIKYSFKIKDIFFETSNNFPSRRGHGFAFCKQDQYKSFLIDNTLTIQFKLELLNDPVEPLLS